LFPFDFSNTNKINMPLDYSKWDNLELSDDSDIEVHPNVDKRSMIKWKQEAIHRERAERKAKIEYLEKFIPQQQNVLKKVRELSGMLNDPDDLTGVQNVVKALDQQQAEADPGMMVPAPNGGKDGGAMNVAQVFTAMKAQIATGLATASPTEVKNTLLDRFKQTETTVQQHVDGALKELEKLNQEASKKMTSENMFKEVSNKTVSAFLYRRTRE
jgi:cell division cycle protein 37